MKIQFGIGIIKGKFHKNTLTVLLENPHRSKEQTVELTQEELPLFLEAHDYVVHFGKNGSFSFEKVFIDNQLGNYIKKNGISQTYIANRLGVSRSYVNQLCRATNLELATVYRILKALNLDAADINLIFPPKNLNLLDF